MLFKNNMKKKFLTTNKKFFSHLQCLKGHNKCLHQDVQESSHTSQYKNHSICTQKINSKFKQSMQSRKSASGWKGDARGIRIADWYKIDDIDWGSSHFGAARPHRLWNRRVGGQEPRVDSREPRALKCSRTTLDLARASPLSHCPSPGNRRNHRHQRQSDDPAGHVRRRRRFKLQIDFVPL